MTDIKNVLAAAILCLEVIPELEEYEEYGEETSVKVGELIHAAHHLVRFAYSVSRPEGYADVVRKGIAICYDGVVAKDAAPDFDGLGLEV